MTYLGDRAPAHALLTKLREVVVASTAVGSLYGGSPTRIPPEATSWHQGILGELQVATLLDQLPRDWLVLHSVPLGDGERDIDHLVVTPVGRVFSINTKHHARSAIWAAQNVLMVNGHREPHIFRARDEAEKASFRLSRAVKARVIVEPFLVFVGERSITIKE